MCKKVQRIYENYLEKKTLKTKPNTGESDKPIEEPDENSKSQIINVEKSEILNQSDSNECKSVQEKFSK